MHTPEENPTKTAQPTLPSTRVEGDVPASGFAVGAWGSL